MINYNMSNSLKDYQQENGIVLSDSEIATLIYNSRNCEELIHQSLLELADRTDDKKLEQQILERIRLDTDKRETFIHNKGNAIYYLKLYDESINEYVGNGFFTDFDVVFKAAVKYGVKYEIVKHKIRFNEQEVLNEIETDMYLDSLIGIGYFQSDGKTWCIKSKEYDNPVDLLMEKERFELQYIKLWHPFRKGEIVKNVIDGSIEL